jgi:hypothetical protein
MVTLLSGCSFFVRPKVTYEIENKTTKNLNLKIFSKSKLLNNISISALSKYDTTITFSDPGDNGQSSPFDSLIVDSITVTFDNSKIIKYYCDGEILHKVGFNSDCLKNKKNLLDFNFVELNQIKSTTIKRLIFDENDFIGADPI